MKRFLSILVARNREYLRDRSALTWSVVMPVLLIFGFAFMFSDEGQEMFRVGVYHGEAAAPPLAFLQTHYIKFVDVDDLAAAVVKVQHHQLDLLLDTRPVDGALRYWINSTSKNGYIVEHLLMAEGKPLTRQSVEGREIRYVDWVIPGVLSMNMMFSALFGVGYVIVRYRKNGMLRRLKVTPVTAFEFLAAQVVSRLWLILAFATVIYIGSDYFLDFIMRGSYLDLFIVFLIGTICLISLALLVASRVSSEELAGGLLNLCTWPMMLLSGIWFSLEGTHPWVQKAAQILPLTHVVNGARKVMNEGAGLLAISHELIVLSLMTAVFLALGAFLFRWE